jgi:amylosucrase
MVLFDPKDIFLIEEKFKKHGINKNIDSAFTLRLAQILPILKDKFYSLYWYRPDKDQAYETLVENLIISFKNRKTDLKKTDLERSDNPHWFQSAEWTGMMLYSDRFSGNISSLTSRLDYLDDLGVNLIHLMPILKAPKENNDGGYAVSDYRNLDEKFGNIDDLEAFTADLRKGKKLLMFDMVVNHTSEEHAWAEAAKKGDSKFQEYYYMFDSREIPDHFEQSMPQVFPEMAPGNFTFDQASQKWVMTVFHQYQWDLNYSNPWVFLEMADNMLFLLNCGVDIIRLDALAFLWKRIGTSCQNLDEAHQIIQLFKCCSQIVAPGAILLAEAIVAPVEIVKYLGQSSTVSNECDMAYNATLMTLLWESIATKNNKLLNKSLSQIPSKPKGTSWLNYVRCHDDIGLGYDDAHAQQVGYSAWDHRSFITNFLTNKIDWSFSSGMPFMEDYAAGTARISGSLASLAGLEKAIASRNDDQIEKAISRILLLHSVILCYGGIPMIYSGDELALLNDYSYENDPAKRSDNRWVHRPIMDWGLAKSRNDLSTVSGRIFQGIKHMIAIRKASPEFADTDNCLLVDCNNQHLFAYLRIFNNSKTLAICNLNDHPEAINMNTLIQVGFDLVKGVSDKLTGDRIAFNEYQYVLKPYQVVWVAHV